MKTKKRTEMPYSFALTTHSLIYTGLCMGLKLFTDKSGNLYLASAWENGNVYLWDARNPAAIVASTEGILNDNNNNNDDGQEGAGRLHKEPIVAFDLAVLENDNDHNNTVMGISGAADDQISVFRVQLGNAAAACNKEDQTDINPPPPPPTTTSTTLQANFMPSSSSSSPSTHSSTSTTTTTMATCRLVKRLKLSHPGIGSVKVRPSDRKIFATGGWDKRLRIWDAKRMKPLAILKQHDAAINCLAFSSAAAAADNNLLVSGSSDTRIACWKIY